MRAVCGGLGDWESSRLKPAVACSSYSSRVPRLLLCRAASAAGLSAAGAGEMASTLATAGIYLCCYGHSGSHWRPIARPLNEDF